MLKNIRDAFSKAGIKQKWAACENLVSTTAGGAWDINELAHGGGGTIWPRRSGNECAIGGNCNYTVWVDGGCHYGGSVNYVSFGVMWSQCARYLPWMTDPNLMAAINYWKGTGQGFQEQVINVWLKGKFADARVPEKNFKASQSWAAAGFWGWPDICPIGYCSRPKGKTPGGALTTRGRPGSGCG